MAFAIQQVAPYTNMIFWVFLGLIGLGAIAAVVMFFMIYLRFNKKVTIKVKNGNSWVTEEDTCMERIDDDGHKWWVRFKCRDKSLKNMPAPPSSAMSVTRKGKDCAMAKLIDGHYIWLEDKNDVAAIPPSIFKGIQEQVKDIVDIDKRILETKKLQNQAVNKWMEEEGVDVGFQPFTPTERAILVNAIKRAEERKMKGWQTQLPMIIGVGAAVILVICLLVFYGNIAKPVLPPS